MDWNHLQHLADDADNILHSQPQLEVWPLYKAVEHKELMRRGVVDSFLHMYCTFVGSERPESTKELSIQVIFSESWIPLLEQYVQILELIMKFSHQFFTAKELLDEEGGHVVARDRDGVANGMIPAGVDG